MLSLSALREYRRQDTESGFTLIELLVVILIIGVLAAIAVPMFLNQRKSAYEASMKSDMQTISQTMENCLIKIPTSYADVYVNWAGRTSIPPCFSDLKLSSGTQTHSFDLYWYPPAGWTVPAGQIYCIEISNANNPGTTKYFRSDKGVMSDTSCQSQ